MKSTLCFIVASTVWMIADNPVRAQADDTPDLAELRKHGIIGAVPVSYDARSWEARVKGAGVNYGKLGDLLRPFKNLTTVRIELNENKLADDHVDLVNRLPTIQGVHIDAIQLSDKEIQKIATWTRVEHLTLESVEITSNQLRILEQMKGLKMLEIHSTHNPPQAALAELKKTFQEVSFVRMPTIYFMQPLKAANDTLDAQLAVEKYNAALVAMKSFVGRDNQTGNRYGSSYSFIVTRCLKESILGLRDPAIRKKALEGYLDFTKVAAEDTKKAVDSGYAPAFEHETARYFYLDAQLLQARFNELPQKE